MAVAVLVGAVVCGAACASAAVGVIVGFWGWRPKR